MDLNADRLAVTVDRNADDPVASLAGANAGSAHCCLGGQIANIRAGSSYPFE
jgi:hypothetical protein